MGTEDKVDRDLRQARKHSLLVEVMGVTEVIPDQDPKLDRSRSPLVVVVVVMEVTLDQVLTRDHNRSPLEEVTEVMEVIQDQVPMLDRNHSPLVEATKVMEDMHRDIWERVDMESEVDQLVELELNHSGPSMVAMGDTVGTEALVAVLRLGRNHSTQEVATVRTVVMVVMVVKDFKAAPLSPHSVPADIKPNIQNTVMGSGFG